VPRKRKQEEYLVIRVEPQLMATMEARAERLGVDVATYARWCVQTGFLLTDLNAFVRSKLTEND